MSIDGTRAILQQYAAHQSQIKVIDNPGTMVATGLNLAIQHARGDFIVRMDAHTHYLPEYVLRCVNVSIATGADNVGGAARTVATSFWQRAIAAGFHSRFATGGASFRSEEYTGFTDTVPYGCWRRDTLLALGLFDETLIRNQDDDLNFRIRQAGGKVWQDASIVSYYHPRSTIRTLFRQYFQYGFWRVATLRKHSAVASVRQLVPVIALAASSFLALSLLLGLVLRNTLLLKSSAWLLILSGIVYAGFSAIFTIAAAKHHGWKLIPVLPLVFATYQFSYAAGFAAGLFYGMRPSPEQVGMPRLFVDASR